MDKLFEMAIFKYFKNTGDISISVYMFYVCETNAQILRSI